MAKGSQKKEEVSFLIAQDHIGFLSAAPGGLLLTAMWHKSVRMAETFLALCGKGFRLSVCSCSMASRPSTWRIWKGTTDG